MNAAVAAALPHGSQSTPLRGLRACKTPTRTRAEEALGLWDACPETIDLVLTDIVMSGMNRLDLADHLAGLRPGVRVLFMSGYHESFVSHDGESSNYLPKPFAPQVLTEKVRELLAR